VIADLVCPVQAGVLQPTGRIFTAAALHEVCAMTCRLARTRRLYATLDRGQRTHRVFLSDVAGTVLYAEMADDRMVCTVDFLDPQSGTPADVAMWLVHAKQAVIYPSLTIWRSTDEWQKNNVVVGDDIPDAILHDWRIDRMKV
jgi:hypothetical protein